MHGPLLCYRWSKDHGLLISSEKGVKKKRIPTSWVMHAQDQHGSGLESVMFWLQRINFYILKKEREKGIALVLKAKISGWQEAATCIYGMDRMIGSLAFWGCYFSVPSALRWVALFGWQDSFFCDLMVLLPAKLVDQMVHANYTDFISFMESCRITFN